MLAGMAKNTQTIVTLTDDLDGGKADRTVTFSYDGVNYEIDLSKKNANALDKAVSPYLNAARKVRRSRTRATASAGKRSDLAEIRAWAKANGHDLSDRGRIPAAVTEAYDAAK